MKLSEITKSNVNAVGVWVPHIDPHTKINMKPIANAVGAGPVSARNSRGITLVALIITIIVMLIIVAVSVTIAIKGNLFGITKEAAKQTTIEAYRENLEAIRVNAMMEQIKNELTTAEFMDKVEEGIRANSVFNGGKIKKTNTSVKVITKEGYLFKITESKVIYMGMADEQGELTMDLSDKNTKFILDPEGWTKNAVKVSIEIRVDAEELGAVLQYSLDGGNSWEEYKEALKEMEYGQVIKARLWNEEEGEEGTYAEKKVTNIDRLNPKQFVPTGTSTENSITLTGNTTDSEETSTSGSSGIKLYYYSIDDGKTWLPEKGTEETSYTFNNLPKSVTYTTLKMKAVDNVGNEVITEAITATTNGPKVGDYVNYKPDTVTESYNLLPKYSGLGSEQSISQEPLKWRILKIYEDGSIDLIGTPTNNEVYFSGALGYNNGVYLMHDICKALYSKHSDGVDIDARSVSLEDFEDEENGGNWKEARNTYIYKYDENSTEGVRYNKTQTYETYYYYPNLYAKENGSGINTAVVKTDGISSSDKGYESPTEEKYNQANAGSLTVTQTYYNISINETNYGKVANVLKSNDPCWMATRSVRCAGDSAGLGLRRTGQTVSMVTMINTMYGEDYVDWGKLRPIVTLKPNTQLELVEEGTNSSSNPHKIINY